MNSQRKGAAGELEAAKYLADLFRLPVHRGRQYRGGPDSPDVAGLAGLHFEIKRVQRLNVERALRQAENDAASVEVPLVLHRANREGWKLTLRADDLLRFLDAAERLIEEGHRADRRPNHLDNGRDAEAGARPTTKKVGKQ